MPVPTREGYDFCGWEGQYDHYIGRDSGYNSIWGAKVLKASAILGPIFTEEFSENTIINSNAQLLAIWLPHADINVVTVKTLTNDQELLDGGIVRIRYYESRPIYRENQFEIVTNETIQTLNVFEGDDLRLLAWAKDDYEFEGWYLIESDGSELFLTNETVVDVYAYVNQTFVGKFVSIEENE